jgi:hypothetical protein
LGEYLDGLYADAMARYNALAPELATVVLEVAAIRRVMIRRLTGNSNGWSGEILLPGMKPKEGKWIPRLLDGGSPEFDATANATVQQVEAKLRSAGFMY